MEDVRTAIANTNAVGPVGVFDGNERAITIATNDQLRTAPTTIPSSCAAPTARWCGCRRSPRSRPGVRNSRSAGWFNGQPSVLLVINKQADANVIETVDRIYELLPEIKRWIPAGIEISVLSDRTRTIRASVLDMQLTLLATVVLVMLVVFVFLRRAAATIAAGVTVPLSLAGTCAMMWVAGFSIDNLSLMALAVSVGFVVDDAIVMIENCFRNLEKGMSPLRAAIEGARQIGFTVLVDQHFAGRGLHPAAVHDRSGRPRVPRILGDARLRDRGLDGGFADGDADDLRAFRAQAAEPGRHLVRPAGRARAGVAAARSMPAASPCVLNHRALTLLVMAATHRDHRHALRADPERLFPAGRYRPDLGRHPGLDRGLVPGDVRAAAEGGSDRARRSRGGRCRLLDRQLGLERVGQPRLAVHQPQAAGGTRRITTQAVAARLRQKTANIPGLRVFFFPMQDVRVGGRHSDSTYQYTLWDADYDELLQWAPRVLAEIQTLPGLVDVSTDREQGGLQVNVSIDRVAAVAARRARAGHRQRAQQRLCAAPDFDPLYPAQPVPRHSGDRSATISAIRPISPASM